MVSDTAQFQDAKLRNIDYPIPFGQRNISIKAHKIRAKRNEQQKKKSPGQKKKQNSGSLGCMVWYPSIETIAWVCNLHGIG